MPSKNPRLKLVTGSTKPSQTKMHDDTCKDCRAAEALATDPTLAPPPGSFLHYLVTLPRPLSRAEGRDAIEWLSWVAARDRHLHETCAEAQDWGPWAVQRYFAWTHAVGVGTLHAFHLAMAAWLNDIEPVALSYLRSRIHAMLNQLARAYAIDPPGTKPMARTLGRQVAVSLSWAETAIHAVDSEDCFCDLVDIVHMIRHALDDGPESYPVYEADIQKALKATAPKQAGRA